VLVYLTATLATMLEQFKLITLAAAGFAVFGTRYSSIQILALFSLMLAMVQYALLSSEQAGSGINIKLGLLLQSAFVLISTLSTILREFKFKGGSTGVVEDFSELQWTVGSNTQIFHGWDWATIRVIIVMLACDWLSNYIQKQLLWLISGTLFMFCLVNCRKKEEFLRFCCCCKQLSGWTLWSCRSWAVSLSHWCILAYSRHVFIFFILLFVVFHWF
ncbi:unnamed protein product, partial [Polarella glacialis]